MTRRYLLFSLLLIGMILSRPAPALAQCLPPQVLRYALASPFIKPDSVARLLSATEWVFQEGDSLSWMPRPAAGAGYLTQARLELRRSNQQAGYDVVYKTTRRACLVQLRADLRQHSSLLAQYVHCMQCDGERLVGYGYVITIINQRASYAAKRVKFPYVLVMRRTTGDTQDSEELTPELSQLLSAP